MSERTEGKKYQETKDLDIVEVAKLVRKDLREHYPKYKFSVRCQKYSLGCSLNIEASNTGIERGTSTASDTRDTIRRIADQYNYDNSDSMSDYFEVKFYVHVRIDD